VLNLLHSRLDRKLASPDVIVSGDLKYVAPGLLGEAVSFGMERAALLPVESRPEPAFIDIRETEIEDLIIREIPHVRRILKGSPRHKTANGELEGLLLGTIRLHIDNACQPHTAVLHREVSRKVPNP
jgi:hypothetical protein